MSASRISSSPLTERACRCAYRERFGMEPKDEYLKLAASCESVGQWVELMESITVLIQTVFDQYFDELRSQGLPTSRGPDR